MGQKPGEIEELLYQALEAKRLDVQKERGWLKKAFKEMRKETKRARRLFARWMASSIGSIGVHMLRSALRPEVSVRVRAFLRERRPALESWVPHEERAHKQRHRALVPRKHLVRTRYRPRRLSEIEAAQSMSTSSEAGKTTEAG